MYETAQKIKTAMTNRNLLDVIDTIKSATNATDEEVMELAVAIDRNDMHVYTIAIRLQRLQSLVKVRAAAGSTEPLTLADRIANEPIRMAKPSVAADTKPSCMLTFDDLNVDILTELDDKAAAEYPDLDKVADRDEYLAALVDVAAGEIKRLRQLRDLHPHTHSDAETVPKCFYDTVIAEKDRYEERALKAETQSRRKDSVIETIQSARRKTEALLKKAVIKNLRNEERVLSAEARLKSWQYLAEKHGVDVQALREVRCEEVQKATQGQETPQRHAGRKETTSQSGA